MNLYPRVIVAGTESGVGKTTLTIGLIMALKKRDISIQTYKTGPDYIDAGFHTRISRRPCRNLDSYILSRNVILEIFERQASQVSLSLIEGAMGLFDGRGDNSEIGSTAHIAKILNSPILLILDAGKMGRSAAALAWGYKGFDRKINIAGFVLNRIGSPSHYRIAKEAIEKKTGLPVLGYLPQHAPLALPERHLGLVPVKEIELGGYYRRLIPLMEKHIDIGKILKIAGGAGPLPPFKKNIFARKAIPPLVTIALAYDKAFHFYYEDNLDILKHYGARFIYFSPLKSRHLPPSADGLYLGGGFPEIFARELSRNRSLRKDILKKAREGLPIYAECGGLMYLARELIDSESHVFPMVGIFPGSVKMGPKLRSLGLVEALTLRDNILSKRGERIRGHVFHWSYLTRPARPSPFVYKLSKDHRPPIYDGLKQNRVLAGYLHLHFGSNINFAKRFIKSCWGYKKKP